jgi:phosphoglycolate phosphatase
MRALLFDKDGTLLDFEASWSRVLRELCLDLAEGNAALAESMLLSGGFDPVSGRFRSGGALAAGHTLDIVRLWYPALTGAALRAMVERIDKTFYENGITCSVPVPGLAETLHALSESGFTMGVATNDGTAATKAALAALKLSHFLPHVFGYDSVERPKPAPDIVHAFAEATGVPLQAIAVIGDNPHDLEMARAAGAGAAIGVLSGNGNLAELHPLADVVLESVCDLPGWLAAQSSGQSPFHSD